MPTRQHQGAGAAAEGGEAKGAVVAHPRAARAAGPEWRLWGPPWGARAAQRLWKGAPASRACGGEGRQSGAANLLSYKDCNLRNERRNEGP